MGGMGVLRSRTLFDEGRELVGLVFSGQIPFAAGCEALCESKEEYCLPVCLSLLISCPSWAKAGCCKAARTLRNHKNRTAQATAAEGVGEEIHCPEQPADRDFNNKLDK